MFTSIMAAGPDSRLSGIRQLGSGLVHAQGVEAGRRFLQAEIEAGAAGRVEDRVAPRQAQQPDRAEPAETEAAAGLQRVHVVGVHVADQALPAEALVALQGTVDAHGVQAPAPVFGEGQALVGIHLARPELQQQLRGMDARGLQRIPAVGGQLPVPEDPVAAITLGQGLVEEVVIQLVAWIASVAAQLGLAEKTADEALRDRKSTRLNSSHVKISYAVFCLKKKKE